MATFYDDRSLIYIHTFTIRKAMSWFINDLQQSVPHEKNRKVTRCPSTTTKELEIEFQYNFTRFDFVKRESLDKRTSVNCRIL